MSALFNVSVSWHLAPTHLPVSAGRLLWYLTIPHIVSQPSSDMFYVNEKATSWEYAEYETIPSYSVVNTGIKSKKMFLRRIWKWFLIRWRFVFVIYRNLVFIVHKKYEKNTSIWSYLLVSNYTIRKIRETWKSCFLIHFSLIEQPSVLGE